MHPSQVLSRALNTHNYKKDVTETGAARDRNPSKILGRAQESLFSLKNGFRLFGVGSNDDGASALLEEPEMVEIREPVRNTPSAAADETAAIRVAKVRRSSMTTYTVTLGATPGQVDREVRRLAGLAQPAFTRPAGESPPAHATSFDAVEELNSPTPGPRPSSNRDNESGDSDSGAISGGAGGEGTGLISRAAPVKAAFSNLTNSAPYGIIPFNGGGGGRRGRTLGDDVTPVVAAGVTGAADSRGPSFDLSDAAGGGRGGFASSVSHPVPLLAFDGHNNSITSGIYNSGGGGSSGLLRSATAVPSPLPSSRGPKPPPPSVSHSCLSLNLGPSTPGAGGQLGLMKDRKGAPSRHTTNDGLNSSPGPVSPATPGCPGGAWVGTAGATSAGTSPTGVLRLPTLPQAAPSRATSNSQIVGRVASLTSTEDSRPPSSRMMARGPIDQKGSHEPTPAALAADSGSSGGGGYSSGTYSVGGGAVSGGRWFQQDVDDVDMMLAGNEELLEKIMGASGGPGPSPGGAAAAGGGTGGGGGASVGGGSGNRSAETDWLGQMSLLPRILPSDGPPDRALASLQELRKVQASLEDQFSKERQAIAAGRVRRASVLEDVAGQQQPRWQITYNTEASVTHAKLGIVDATRRSDVDKAYLGKMAKEQKPAQPSIPAAAVSPVVARARRLSTVVVS